MNRVRDTKNSAMPQSMALKILGQRPLVALLHFPCSCRQLSPLSNCFTLAYKAGSSQLSPPRVQGHSQDQGCVEEFISLYQSPNNCDDILLDHFWVMADRASVIIPCKCNMPVIRVSCN